MADVTGEQEPAWERVTEVLTSFCLHKALQAAVKLHVFDILAGEDQQLSARDILTRMQATYQPSIKNPTAHNDLDRVLRLLAANGLLASSSSEGDDGQLPVRRYGITGVSRFLAVPPEGGASLGVLSIMTQETAFTEALQVLDQAILEGVDAFTLAHGKPPFLYGHNNPTFATLFREGMTNYSNLFMGFLLRSYDGFLSVRTLVDVGGGAGACLNAIVAQYPHIKGINFDQPQVIASAHSYPGVEHVGGDMFKSVPQGDAIFMKEILHNWSDESCIEILKNCYQALPANGKVIIVDVIMSTAVETTPAARVQSHMDIYMLAFFKGAKERTLQELQGFANVVGFKKTIVSANIHDKSVVEMYKE